MMGESTSKAAVLLAALAILAGAGPAAALENIGVVRSVSGSAVVVRGETTLAAVPGMKLHGGDALGTGPDGSLGVILRDDSSLSLGPGSRIVIRTFVYSPKEGKFDLLGILSRGTMAYLSGLIGKLAPGTARFETPTATIGIRGTRFAVMVGEPSAP